MNKMDSNSQNFDDKNNEKNIKDQLLHIAQLARKVAYWLDPDTEFPEEYNKTIKIINQKLSEMNDYVNDQMIDISDNLNEEVKSVPTKPEVWSRVKKNALEKSGKKELGKVSTWLATKEYKDKGGKWRKKKRKKD